MTTRGQLPTLRGVLLLSCISVLSLMLAAAAEGQAPPLPSERALITLLQSKAPPAEKALACKQLTLCGTKDAVPALAALLSDPQLASWARIGLEAIPGPAPEAALRRAMGKLQGDLLVGVINSLGVRRDPKAVGGLATRLKHADPEVASAAAVALGRIGGAKAAKALSQALPAAPAAVRPAVAEGSILCAESFLARGKPAEAGKLYDTVRAADVPRQNQLEAIRGAILARQSAGLPLLLEQLRSPDQALFGIGLRTARELPGRDVTEALAADLPRTSPERQPFLLLALADREDAAVLPALLAAANTASKKLRLTAIGALERRGNPSSLPVLLQAAAAADTDIAKAALGALTRLPGNEVDADLLARLPAATGKTRRVLIQVAGQRHLDRAVPTFVRDLQSPDAGVRAAAVQAVGILGDDSHAVQLVGLLQESRGSQERTDIETALLAISGRTGARSVPALLPLARNTDAAMRIIALHLLASAGGSRALEVVAAAAEDQDEGVRDEAVRTLSTWPNNWPEDSGVAQPLLALARSGSKTSHQVLALRAYLQYVQGDKQLKDGDKVSRITEVLPLMKRPEEKRLAIAAVGAIPTPGALELLATLAAEPAVAEDACSAILKLADPLPPTISRAQCRNALQAVAEKATSEETRKKASQLLKAGH